MKHLTLILFFTIAIFMLVGCGGDTNEESTADASEDSSVVESTEEESTEEVTTETDESTSASEDANDDSGEESVTNESDDTTSSENDNSDADEENEDPLSQYSSEQIEYARVWLQLGPNQELDELNVYHISDGTPLNSDDETSVSYPEDVIQLAGSRLVDGSITYSGNGDGTINVYNVPLRWDGQFPAGEEFYTDIIENTELVSIDTGNDEEVIELIELLNN